MHFTLHSLTQYAFYPVFYYPFKWLNTSVSRRHPYLILPQYDWLQHSHHIPSFNLFFSSIVTLFILLSLDSFHGPGQSICPSCYTSLVTHFKLKWNYKQIAWMNIDDAPLIQLYSERNVESTREWDFFRSFVH
jgi:hypothetical protein